MKLTNNTFLSGQRFLQGMTVLGLALTMVTPALAQSSWHRSDSATSAWTQGRWNNGGNEAANRQKNKNDWRNITIGAGAVGLYGLLKGDSTAALVGAAGAAYAADRYEQDRHSQSQQSDRWQDQRDFHRQDGDRHDRDRQDEDQRSYDRDNYDRQNKDQRNQDRYNQNRDSRDGRNRNQDRDNHDSGNRNQDR